MTEVSYDGVRIENRTESAGDELYIDNLKYMKEEDAKKKIIISIYADEQKH